MFVSSSGHIVISPHPDPLSNQHRHNLIRPRPHLPNLTVVCPTLPSLVAPSFSSHTRYLDLTRRPLRLSTSPSYVPISSLYPTLPTLQMCPRSRPCMSSLNLNIITLPGLVSLPLFTSTPCISLTSNGYEWGTTIVVVAQLKARQCIYRRRCRLLRVKGRSFIKHFFHHPLKFFLYSFDRKELGNFLLVSILRSLKQLVCV